MTSTKERIVIVGNGMAGARFAEELVARDGDDRFDITMFGDEPGGSASIRGYMPLRLAPRKR